MDTQAQEKAASQLKSKVAALEELLVVQEQAVLVQSGRLEQALKKLQQHADELKQVNKQLEAEIADRKQAEEQARRSEAMLQRLVEDAPDAIVVVNGQGHLIRLNGQAERMFGYHRDELLNTPIEVLIPERFRQQHVHHRTGFQSQPVTRPMGKGLTLYGRRKDGTEFPAEIMLSPLKTPEDRMVIAIARDITERKNLEDMLRREKEALREMNQIMTGREERVVEVKQEVNVLLKELNRLPKYNV